MYNNKLTNDIEVKTVENSHHKKLLFLKFRKPKTNRKMKPSIDVDSLRTEHESDEQWDVRRSFMIEHKDNFDEAELITLAQLFTNIEFLGCRYPQQTMLRIANMAEKVSAKYKESRKNKLKRTFVEASDAAEQKAKRTFK